MSELKAHNINYLSLHDIANCEFYIKSEADKVIEEKDAEIARLKAIRKVHVEAIESMGAGLLQDEEENRHSKYKRCLAMAQWCKDKIDAINNGYIVSSIESQNGVMTTCPPECNPKFSFYIRWHTRWSKLAEKFKEAK